MISSRRLLSVIECFLLTACLLFPFVGCDSQKDLTTKGSHRDPDGAIYLGSFNDSGKYEGQGTLTYPDGRKYEGQFRNGLKDGSGVLTFPGGETYTGDFTKGRMHGNGTLSYPDGQHYEGQFKNGLPDG